MVKVEGIEHVGKDDETEFDETKEDGEAVEKRKVTSISLVLIYAAIYWSRKPDGSPWNDAEIEQIVDQALLCLNEGMYRHLDLGLMIRRLRQEEGNVTVVKLVTEKTKINLLRWIPQLYQEFLDMCRKDEK